MHFHDLELCTYGHGATSPDSWRVPLLAIGWLEAGRRFAKGEANKEMTARVRQFQKETGARFSMHAYRGLHGCTLCDSGEASDGIDGSHINLFIPGKDCIYMASGGIAHYLERHSYLPPEVFVTALMSCPFPSTFEYSEALIATNCGERPEFLWTFEEKYPALSKRRSEPSPPADASRG